MRSTLKRHFGCVQSVAPTEKIVSELEDLISPLMERIRNYLFESRALAGLCVALLPKLISGQLRVPVKPVEVK